MTDVFCVPASELTPEQVAQKGLLESEIDWESPEEPDTTRVSPEDEAVFKNALAEIRTIIQEMNANERARKEIAGWRRDILVKACGGAFGVLIDDGDIRLEDKAPEAPDLIMVCQDPRTLLDVLAYRGAITDSIINGKTMDQ